MRAGTENRTKTIAAGALGTCALIGVVYVLYTTLGGSSPTPPPSIAPTVPVARTIANANTLPSTPAAAVAANAGSRPAAMPSGNAPGVARKVATSAQSLDPTLDQTSMLRTEQLVYSGSGRNIFSATYTPPVVIPKVIAPVRKGPPPPPPGPYVAPPPPTCPPSCPPINLKFFGTAVRGNGQRQAFLLQGDDVFLASQGDIVARKYRIVSIAPNSIQVEDLANTNTQTLPLQN